MPTPHVWHTELFVAPRTVEKVPASHLIHEDMFSFGLYVPMTHWVQAALPGWL